MDIRFCPTCGEDLRSINSPAPVVKAVPQEPQTLIRPELIRREVLRQEVEGLWGLNPLPSGMRPLGVLSFDSGKTATSVVCEDIQGRLWDCLAGQTKMLDAAFGSSQPRTVPEVPAPLANSHVCSRSRSDDEALGQSRYGSKI